MKKLQSIDDFGTIDADNDAILSECFEDHEAYQKLLQRTRFLIVGRKGSGKTAIFRRLHELQNPHRLAAGYKFANYPWDYHDHQVKVGMPAAEAYVESWRYFILLAFTKLLLQAVVPDGGGRREAEARRNLESFLRDTYGTLQPQHTEFFRPTVKVKARHTLGLNFLALKAESSLDSVPISDLPRFAAEINDAITENLLVACPPNIELHVAFDDLDTRYRSGDEQYASRLVGLILAARRVNVSAREAGRPLLASVFLRSDILDELRFEDRNKIIDVDAVRIEWDTGKGAHTLRELMERRFTLLLSECGSPILWNDVFSGAEMTSKRQQYDYILDRTFSRPRDMIHYCNDVLAAYKLRLSGHVQSRTLQGVRKESRSQFDNSDILNAREAYGAYFRSEIQDEIYQHVPQWEAYLEVLRSIGTQQFTYANFLKTLNERRAALKIEADPYTILRDLFKFSIIGFRRSGGRSGGSQWVFTYKEPPGVYFDETANLFRVHYGLVETLKLSRNSPLSKIAPEVKRKRLGESQGSLFNWTGPREK